MCLFFYILTTLSNRSYIYLWTSSSVCKDLFTVIVFYTNIITLSKIFEKNVSGITLGSLWNTFVYIKIDPSLIPFEASLLLFLLEIILRKQVFQNHENSLFDLNQEWTQKERNDDLNNLFSISSSTWWHDLLGF